MEILDWSKDVTNVSQYFMMMHVPINVLKKKDGAGTLEFLAGFMMVQDRLRWS